MKLGALLVINAILAAAFGIAFVIAPAQLLSMYGIAVTPGTTVVSRLFGASLLGYASLTWQVRDLPDSTPLRAILYALFASDIIGLIISISGQLSGAVNGLGWLTVAIYLFLSAGYGYFAFKKPSAVPAAPSP